MELMAITMLRAIVSGARYPPDGIADTPENRELWDELVADVKSLPPGVMPDIPSEWADWPDDLGASRPARRAPHDMIETDRREREAP